MASVQAGAAPFGGDREQVTRYSRQLLLPRVGLAGQERLRQARVLVVGAGGLGSPVLTYLAGAGVGTLGIIDGDDVDLSNLHRQVVHATPDVGRPKVESARARVLALNPHVRVEVHEGRVCAANAAQLVASYDIVVDGTDNFATRYLLNDACVLVGRPLVWAAVLEFDGQLTVWWPGRGPCYRCVFPTPPAPGSVPSCAEAGVVGTLPGVLGTLQAAEVIKIIVGVGGPLVGRLLLYDALTASFSHLPVRRNPACPACGEGATIVLADDPYACRVGESAVAGPPVQALAPDAIGQIDAPGLAALLDDGRPLVLLDVREAVERDIALIEPSSPAVTTAWMPLPRLRLDPVLPGIERDAQVVVYCHGGVRSMEAARLLAAAGYRDLVNLRGGIHAWALDVDPSMARY